MGHSPFDRMMYGMNKKKMKKRTEQQRATNVLLMKWHGSEMSLGKWNLTNDTQHNIYNLATTCFGCFFRAFWLRIRVWRELHNPIRRIARTNERRE